MSQWLNDTFTGTAGADLVSAHTGEVGATWATKTGFGATIDSTGGRIFGNTLAGTKFYPSGGASADVDFVTVYFDVLTAQSMSIMLRWTASNDYGYQLVINALNTSATIYRYTSGGYTAVGSAHALTFTSTGNVLIFKATGTGASVVLDVDINGATFSETDTSGNRIVVPAKTAIEFGTNGSNSTGILISRITGDDSATTDVASITGPLPNSIAPLSTGVTGTGTLALAFTYSGTAPNQWRLVDDGGSTAISGFDWQSFGTAPSAGTGSQSVTSVPKKNGWYNLQIRNSATPGTIQSTSGKLGVGVLVSINGQSNATNWFVTGDSSLTPDSLTRVFVGGAWLTPSTAAMNAAIACGNALAALVQCPVALIKIGVSGAAIGTWVPTTQTNYTDGRDAIIAAGGKLIAEVWVQGESDADTLTQAQYYTAFGTLAAQRRTDTGQSTLPYVVAGLARLTAGGHTDAGWKAIDDAFVQIAGDSNTYLIQRKDLPLTDGLHHTATGYTALGKRAAQTIAYVYGLVSQYRGPSIASVTRVSAGVFDVNMTHHSGSDFTPTSAITGFQFTDPGASNAVIAVSTAVRQSATSVRCTLASSPVSPPNVAYLYGMAPTITGVVVDNSTLVLPLEYNANVAQSPDVVASTSQGQSASAASGVAASTAASTSQGQAISAAGVVAASTVASTSQGQAAGATSAVAVSAVASVSQGQTTSAASGVAASTATSTSQGQSVGATSGNVASVAVSTSQGQAVGAASVVAVDVAAGVSQGQAVGAVGAVGVGIASSTSQGQSITAGTPNTDIVGSTSQGQAVGATSGVAISAAVSTSQGQTTVALEVGPTPVPTPKKWRVNIMSTAPKPTFVLA